MYIICFLFVLSILLFMHVFKHVYYYVHPTQDHQNTYRILKCQCTYADALLRTRNARPTEEEHTTSLLVDVILRTRHTKSPETRYSSHAEALMRTSHGIPQV